MGEIVFNTLFPLGDKTASSKPYGRVYGVGWVAGVSVA